MLANITDPYLLSAAAGLLASALVIFFAGRARPHDRRHMFLCCVSAIVGMFIGAHLLFFLVGLPGFGEKYGSTIYDVQSFLLAVFQAASGMVFYGGLFGAILGILIYCHVWKLPVRCYLNPIAAVFPLMHAFGRIGCALGGCCYGMEYHGLFAIQYTENHINPGISDHIADFPRFPVQPLEALLEFALFTMLIILLLKTGDRYSITAIYLFSYGIIRFLDEFLRGDVIRGFLGPFSTSQWIALFSILGMLLWFFLRRRNQDCAAERR